MYVKYKKNQYTDGFSICAWIIAGAFYYWGITDLINWSGDFPWWGLIALAIAISITISQIAAIANRSKLRNLVKNELIDNPNASVEEISNNTRVTRKDINAIILDLKMKGELRGKFSSKTGQFKTEEKGETKAKFCPSCGAATSKESAQFCGYCGANFEQ